MDPNPAQVSNDHFSIIVGGLVAVLVALCSLGGVVLPLLVRARNDAREARTQLKNNHGTNLREEADERHGENARKLDWLIGAVTRMQGDITTLYTANQQHDGDIRRLEQTYDPRKGPRP